MKIGLRQPFGMAFYDFSTVMTSGTLTVDIITGHKRRQSYFMGIMAAIASGFSSVKTF
jgi:hypothetical protein